MAKLDADAREIPAWYAPSPQQEEPHSMWGDETVTGIATAIAVLIIALIAILMAMS